MKHLLTNSFRKARNHIFIWISKQSLADWLLYISVAIGLIVGIVLIFSQKLYEMQTPFIAYFAFCMFCGSIATILYFGILMIVWLFKKS